MTLYHLGVHHHTQPQAMSYQDGHRLMAVFSIWYDTAADPTPEFIANRFYRIINTDLNQLETGRIYLDGEHDFLTACVYRLMRLRSLTVGDVLKLQSDHGTWWLALEHAGWMPITEPSDIVGTPLLAERIYARIIPASDRP